MKKAYLLVALLIIALSCVCVFVACSDDTPQEVYEIGIVYGDCEYSGIAANPVINANGREYVIKWYSIDDAGEITELEAAPINVGHYRAVVYLKDHESTSAQVDFNITPAQTTVDTFEVESKTYDGTAVAEPTYKTNSDSTNIKIQYKGVEDTTWSDYAPTEVGQYVARLTIGDTLNYAGIYVDTNFTIGEGPTVFSIEAGAELHMMVNFENKIVNIEAMNQDAFDVREELIKGGAMGMFVTDFTDLCFDVMKAKHYFDEVTDVEVYAQSESVGTMVSQELLAKFAENNLNITVESNEISEDMFKAYARKYLYGFSDSELTQINKHLLRNYLLQVKEDAADIPNVALKNIACEMIDVELIREIVDAIVTKYPTLASNFTEINEYYDEYSAFMYHYGHYTSRYIAEYSDYNIYLAQYFELRNEYYAEFEKDPNSQATAKIEAKYTRIKNAVESYGSPMYGMISDIDEDIANMKNLMSAALIAATEELRDSIDIDFEAIEEEVINKFEADYKNALKFNPITRDELYASGDALFIYQCQEFNKTYVVTQHENDAPSACEVFVYDGMIGLKDLARTKADSCLKGRYVTDRAVLISVTGGSVWTCYIEGDEMSFKFAQGTYVHSTSFAGSNGEIYTVAMFENGSDKITYLYEEDVDVDSLTSVPYYFTGTWSYVDDDSIVVDVAPGFRLNYEIVNGVMELQYDEGELEYDATYYYDDVSYRLVLRTINKGEVNEQQTAYTIPQFITNLTEGERYPYGLSGTWEKVQEGEAWFIYVTLNDGIKYKFGINSNNSLTFVSCEVI